MCRDIMPTKVEGDYFSVKNEIKKRYTLPS